MDFDLIIRVFPFIGEAAILTIKLSVLTLILGLTIGGLIANARFSKFIVIRQLAAVYVSIMRGTPVLIQLFVLFFGGPQIGLSLDAFTSGVIAFGLNIGAYMSEGMRGAILAVDKGQNEAARTLGFNRYQTMVYFILPQSARLMINSIGVNAVILIKGTALISTIGVVDLTFSAQRFVTSTFKPFEIFSVAALYYMIIIFVMTKCLKIFEKRFEIPEGIR